MVALIAREGTPFMRRVINRMGLDTAQHHQRAAFRTVWQLGLFHHTHRTPRGLLRLSAGSWSVL
jgi:hypothetical protein